jgi:BirA family transcriptional regulator, biotin operon repressor / biotin---[acetyl-CoA-carboxylase] ligase
VIKILCSDKDKFNFISNLIHSSDESFIFKQFFYFDSVKSTQDFAYELLNGDDNFYPSVIISDVQTGGKGRKGLHWASPIGGIWISLALETNLKTHELFRIIILVTKLLCQILESITKLRATIKWPNDIFINGKKVAGILLDTEVESDSIKQVIIGIGVNSNNDLNSTKLSIQDKNNGLYDYDITTLKFENQNNEISNRDLIQHFLEKINDTFPRLKSSVFAEELITYYQSKILESQEHLKYRFRVGDSKFNGEIIKINNDGSLLVKNLESNHDNDLIRINSAYDLSKS